MISNGQLRIISRTLIYMLTRRDKISLDDIRYLKSGQGVFPRKMVRYDRNNKKYIPILDPEGNITEQFEEFNKKTHQNKELPYLRNDLFALFDVELLQNQSSEIVGNNFTSLLPFNIVINLYGEDSPDELQYILTRLYSDDVRSWLEDRKISLKNEPTDIAILDQIENQEWWIRRRLVLEMNTSQSIKLKEEFEVKIEKAVINTIEEIGGR